ncbi:hypothetical protein KKE60_08485 [Patescibacteria group bacterium]|nr:hypothetical protein [Patescibacteria group bacterium]
MITPTLILNIKRIKQDDIRFETKNSRRFLHFVRTLNWTNSIKRAHLKVIYLPTVFNDSDDIHSKEGLLKIYRDFTEKDLLEYTEMADWDK